MDRIKIIKIIPYCLISLSYYFLPFPRSVPRGPTIQVFRFVFQTTKNSRTNFDQLRVT